MPTIEEIADWLARASRFQLGCDGMAQVTSTLLQREGLAHSTCRGELSVQGVGTLADHWWVELGWQYPGYMIDFRARQAMGGARQVPSGVFVPDARQVYTRRQVLSLANHGAYEVLAGEPLSAYPPL